MYDHGTIAVQVRAHLTNRPLSTLTEIAVSLRINRHTLTRALRDNGLNFRLLRSEVVLERLHDLSHATPPHSLKEIGYILGFPSQSSFSHYIKRYTRSSTGTPVRKEY